MTQQPSEAPAEAVSMKRPAAVTILIVLTALFVWRASAYSNLASVGVPPDGAPESWFVPLLGDGLVGTAAIIMAIVLWRRQTAGVWLAAVIVHTVALWDLVLSAVNAIREPWETSEFADVIWFVFGFAFLISIVSFYLLSRRDVRDYYQVQN